MADATVLPTRTQLVTTQLSRADFELPSLQNALNATDVTSTVKFNGVLKTAAGATFTGGMLIGIESDGGFVETVWLPTSSSTDGQTFTGCVRGIDRGGLDYTVGDAAQVVAHRAGARAFCSISALIDNLVRAALQGEVGTGGTQLRLGDGASGYKTYGVYLDTGFKGIIRGNGTTTQWSSDGTTWVSIADSAASVVFKVSAADTTPGYLYDKIDVATDGELTKAIGNPAGNETLQLGLATTLTKAEMDALHTGISANVTGTNLATLTAGPTSNADALHTHENASVTVVAGEAINGSSTTAPIALLGNNFKKGLFINATGVTFFDVIAGANQNFGNADSTTWVAQAFTVTDALATSITLESLTTELAKNGAPVDNLTVSIQADSSGAPSGTTITNGTSANVTGGSVSTTMLPVKFTWSTPPTLTSGTMYWAVFKRSGANDAANYYMLRTAGADTYASHNSGTYTASTLTWSTSSTDLQMFMQFNMDYDGKGVYADCDTYPRVKFTGFTQSNVSGGGNLAVVADGVIDGFTGLASGADYWLSGTQGQVTNTLPSRSTSYGSATPIVNVGRAVNTTSIAIDKKYSHVLEVSTAYTAGAPWVENLGASATATCDIFIETGFSPRKFFVRFTQADVGGTAADDRYNVMQFVETTQVMNFAMVATNLSPASASSSISATANDYVSIQAIYENGYLLRIQQKHDDESMSSLSVVCEN